MLYRTKACWKWSRPHSGRWLQESEGVAIIWENQITSRKCAYACLKGKIPGIGSPRVLKRKSRGQNISRWRIEGCPLYRRWTCRHESGLHPDTSIIAIIDRAPSCPKV
jgi:hypothetical protein